MTVKELKSAQLSEAEQGSFYTICGAGGELQEWVDGVSKMMADENIGVPTQWYRTTGAEINEYAGVEDGTQAFQPDLIVLMFRLDGLDLGRLAIFKIRMQDRWFDDIVSNMRAA